MGQRVPRAASGDCVSPFIAGGPCQVRCPLESRPRGNETCQHVFFVDLEGPRSRRERARRAARPRARELEDFGSYPRAMPRRGRRALTVPWSVRPRVRETTRTPRRPSVAARDQQAQKVPEHRARRGSSKNAPRRSGCVVRSCRARRQVAGASSVHAGRGVRWLVRRPFMLAPSGGWVRRPFMLAAPDDERFCDL